MLKYFSMRATAPLIRFWFLPKRMADPAIEQTAFPETRGYQEKCNY